MDKAREPFFYEVQAQIAASEQAASGRFPIYVVDKQAGDCVLRDTHRQAVMGLASSLLLMLLGSQTLSSDKQLGMLRLLQSTPQGHQKLLRTKFRWAWLWALGLTLATAGAEVVKAGADKISLPLDATLYSLVGMTQFRLEIPLWLFLLLLVIYRLLNLSLQAHGVICLTVALHSPWAVLLLASGTLILPQLIQLFSPGTALAYWPLSNAFSLAQIMPGSHFTVLITYYALTIFGIALSQVVARRKYFASI